MLQRQAGEQGNIRVAVCADMNSERPMRLPYVKVEAEIKRGCTNLTENTNS